MAQFQLFGKSWDESTEYRRLIKSLSQARDEVQKTAELANVGPEFYTLTIGLWSFFDPETKSIDVQNAVVRFAGRPVVLKIWVVGGEQRLAIELTSSETPARFSPRQEYVDATSAAALVDEIKALRRPYLAG